MLNQVPAARLARRRPRTAAAENGDLHQPSVIAQVSREARAGTPLRRDGRTRSTEEAMTTTTAVGRLLSVNVGLPQDVEWEGRTVHTGIWKSPVDGPQMVRRLNIDGDGQGDLQGHGGVNRAVYVYQIESHRYWAKFLKRDDFTYGQFGENFTVEGLADDEVCVGDRYRIGSALFEVSQPRVTCYRLGIRMNEPQMPCAAGRAPPPRLLLPGHRGGQGRGGRLDRARRARPRGDDGLGDRRPAVPAAQGAPGPGTGAADPGPEPRLAGLVPRPAQSGGRRRGREAGLGGTAEAPGRGARPRERERDLGATGAGRREARRARPARAVPDRAAAPGPRRRPRCCAPTRCPTSRTPRTTGSASNASRTAPPAATSPRNCRSGT